jgi:hypothetical protein
VYSAPTPALLPPQPLSFTTFGLAEGNAPLFALGNKVSLSLGIAQDAISDHSLSESPEQALR